MILDLLAHNNWERPIYFAITTGGDSYMNLQDYFQLEGLAYRLIPVKGTKSDGQSGRVNTDIMYENLMNKFKWGGMQNPNIFMDENNLRMTYNFRNNFYRLADALLKEGKKEKALMAADRAMEVMPEPTIPYNYFVLPFAEIYYKLGKTEKANKIINRLTEIYINELKYYASLEDKFAQTIPGDMEQSMQVVRQMMYQVMTYEQKDILEDLQAKVNTLPMGKSRTFQELKSKYFAGVN